MYPVKYKLANCKDRNRKQQFFDKENIFWTKAGKKRNVYDEIQANTEGTSVREVLEKYGCIDPIMRPPENSFYGDFIGMMSLREAYEQQDRAAELWAQLSPGFREKFHNDPREFITNGEKVFSEEIKKYKEEQKKAQALKVEVDEGAKKSNEQK